MTLQKQMTLDYGAMLSEQILPSSGMQDPKTSAKVKEATSKFRSEMIHEIDRCLDGNNPRLCALITELAVSSFYQGYLEALDISK